MRLEHFLIVPPFFPLTNAHLVPGIASGAGHTVVSGLRA